MCELTKIQKTCLGHNLRGFLNDKNHKALFRLRAIVERKNNQLIDHDNYLICVEMKLDSLLYRCTNKTDLKRTM